MGKWKKLNEKDLFQGKIFKYRSVESESLDGSMRGQFDVLDFYDWVNIVAVTKDGQMLFVEQFRQGVQDITLEIPGGAIDPGEIPLVAAKRELLEETGFKGLKWHEIGVVHPNPAIMSNRCWSYLALDCEWAQEKDLDPLEDLEVRLISIENVRELVKEGRITHSLVISALYFWEHYSDPR